MLCFINACGTRINKTEHNKKTVMILKIEKHYIVSTVKDILFSFV